MAIVVNEEVLNLSQPSSEIEKWVKKRISEIAEGKKLVVIKDARPRHYSSDRKPDPYPPNLFYMEAKRYDKGVSERWKYCSNPTIKTDKNGNQKPLRGDRAVVGFGELILNPQKQADQIFFFTEIMDVGNFNLVIENREELSKIDNEKRMLRAEAEYNILTKLSDEELYMLAAVYNLDTEEESIDILKKVVMK